VSGVDHSSLAAPRLDPAAGASGLGSVDHTRSVPATAPPVALGGRGGALRPPPPPPFVVAACLSRVQVLTWAKVEGVARVWGAKQTGSPEPPEGSRGGRGPWQWALRPGEGPPGAAAANAQAAVRLKAQVSRDVALHAAQAHGHHRACY
jgi:hypothetical protein